MSADTIPDGIMKAAAEAHAAFARSSVTDNLTLIVAKAIHEAVMAEKERCAKIAEEAVYMRRGYDFAVEYREEIAATIRGEV